MKAVSDFVEDGVSLKAGDEIKPGMFEADRVQSLLAKGLIVLDLPEKKQVKPSHEGGKGKSK